MSCEHDLDAQYLYPSDAAVVDVYEGAGGGLGVTFAMPCPECGEALSLDAAVESVEEGDFELPLDDDRYD